MAGDDTLTVAEDAAETFVNVRANDTDADGDTLTITGKTNGTKGTVAITGSGSNVSYDPQPNAYGPDSFTYTISDGNGGTDTATVAVTITAGQDAPNAVNDEANVAEDGGPTPINVLGNDTDVDGDDLVVTSKTNGAKGTVAINASGDGVTYDPATNQTGADSFTYTISDGHGGTDTATVAVTIGPASDPPVALDDAFTLAEDAPATLVDVLANDTDPDGDEPTITARTNGSKGTVVIAPDGLSLTYKPNANANGSDTFTYTVNDGTGSTDTASVSVTITAVNDPPNAANDGVPTPTKVVLGGGAKAIPVLSNDTSSPDGPETLTIIAKTNGSHGTVAITGGGTGLTYTPTGSTTGIDVFTYTISDGHGGTDTAQVQVQVIAAVDTTPPKAVIVTIQKFAIPGRSGLRIYVKWSLAESGSGLASQLLQRRTGTGSWFTVALPAGARAYNFALPKGHLYTFRVRGTDKAGNVGAFASRQIRI